jgi:SWIB/MDM2 domain
MFDACLGADYDAERRRHVQNAQLDLFREQRDLYNALRHGAISPEVYVDRINTVLRETFEECQVVLGASDFVKLFGETPQNVSGYVDKVAFLAQMRGRSPTTRHVQPERQRARTKVGGVVVQPDEKLAAVVGAKPMARSEITRKVWDYIEKHGLRDKTKRTQINADGKLRRVFSGKASVSMSEMATLVRRHLQPGRISGR